MTLDAKMYIHNGAKFPYDAPDTRWTDAPDAPPPPAVDWAHAAARGIATYLKEQQDIPPIFVGLREDLRLRLVGDLADIIRTTHEQQSITSDK